MDMMNEFKEEGTFWTPVTLEEGGGSLSSRVTGGGDEDVVVSYGLFVSAHSEPNVESGGVIEAERSDVAFGAGLSWVGGVGGWW